MSRQLRAEPNVAVQDLTPAFPIAFWDALLDRYIGTAREELGADGDVAWEEGLQLPFDAAVALALDSD
jgi:hypothetical protein